MGEYHKCVKKLQHRVNPKQHMEFTDLEGKKRLRIITEEKISLECLEGIKKKIKENSEEIRSVWQIIQYILDENQNISKENITIEISIIVLKRLRFDKNEQGFIYSSATIENGILYEETLAYEKENWIESKKRHYPNGETIKFRIL